ncbi:MAG: 4-hydroxythreonine-4-phosphate dehydrogenase PdxA [Devosiaceae bacterium]|nr:4-hydroxythreonine-4-phosphate dehydrogenase PdxA [Devosiaceae bacterium MH13]
MNDRAVPLAVSMGEPAGIGPDVILGAFVALRAAGEPIPMVVFGDPDVMAQRAERLGLTVDLQVAAEPSSLHKPGALPVVATHSAGSLEHGILSKQSAEATLDALTSALDAVAAGDCSGLVTAPLHKANLYQVGFPYPGHTERLEAYARDTLGRNDARAVMMLAGPELRTVPVTVHIPLSEVAHSLKSAAIIDVARVVDKDLKARFGIAQPRLAIAGLNPHAGESGALGTEDDARIAPAVAQLRRLGIEATGPHPADTLFHAEARATYDAALCMYHDQALIPAKALDFHGTVNVTLGLPFVRTSPDHGTALAIAGTGKASPASMVAALRLAWSMVNRGQG